MKLADSVKQSASLTSTATISLGAVVAGYRTLAQAIADTAGKSEQVAVGDVVCMRVDDVADATKFEIADYTIGGTSSAPTLTRGTIRTSSAGGVNPVTFGGSVTVLLTASSNYLTGTTIGQLPTTVAQSGIAGTDLFELEQSGVSGKLSVDAHYAYLVARMQAAGLFNGSGTGGTTTTAPGAPTIGTATAGDGTASFAGTAPTSNGGSAITGYVLTVYKASDNTVVGTFNSATLPISATGLTNGAGVYGKIAANNAVGTGSQSAASNTVTPVAAASTPVSAYNMTPYGGGNSVPSTLNASGVPTYGNLKQIAPQSQVTGGGGYTDYFDIKKISDGTNTASAQCGWSLSGTASSPGTVSINGGEPATSGSNTNSGNSVNCYVGMYSQNGHWINNANLWVPSGFVGTASLWFKGDDGIAKKIATATISGA